MHSSDVQQFNLTGKVALITGASSGLGAHFAKVLCRNGAKVIAAARRLDRLEALADTWPARQHSPGIHGCDRRGVGICGF